MGPSTAAPVSTGGVPPVLPPSVEEAYRRKCVQLRQRMNEVEEGNEAVRLRVARNHRGIEKMRLERAFLLEQLAKRTSTNVEDSEGSPSPPPTPKEKPLRVKRGHRKPSFLHETAAPGAISNNLNAPTLSPSSESFSHPHPGRDPLPMPASNRPRSSVPNGSAPLRPSPSNKPPSAWELFADYTKPLLIRDHQQTGGEAPFNVDTELASLWSTMNPPQKDYWFQQERNQQMSYQQHMPDAERAIQPRHVSTSRAVSQDRNHEERPIPYGGNNYVNYGPPPPAAERLPKVKREDEDVEMQDEAEAPPAAEAEGGGFTAINRNH